MNVAMHPGRDSFRSTGTALLERLTESSPGETPAAIVSGVSDPRLMLQDFRPACQSLEWEIGAHHWRAEGVRPFVKNEVPFLINNDGLLSALAAALVLANQQDATTPEGPIPVIEYGAGSGLFARFFLDELRDVCRQRGSREYDRLTYFVTDASPQTVRDWTERGLFAEHQDHVVLAVCNAERPEDLVSLEGHPILLPRLQAAFCNYVLDVLPCAMVRQGAEGAEEVCIRTLMPTDPAVLAEHTPLGLEAIQAMAASTDPAERAGLEGLMSLFEYEAAFKPVARAIPYLHEAVAWGRQGERVVLNHGALNLLERMLPLLAEGGFALINDYGATDREEQASHGVSQRFGATSAVGINFAFLAHFLEQRHRRVILPPGDASRAIHARLVSCAELPVTERCFAASFAAEAIQALEASAQQARTSVAAGRFSEALDAYREAVVRQPRNWRMLGEIAEFVLFEIKEAEAALELARRALELNPHLSAWLWNILGDALWILGRHAEAHTAYRMAVDIDPTDPRALLNLSYTLLQRADVMGALEAIGRGLAHDKQAIYRERLLAKQQHILATLSSVAGRERERALSRFSRFQADWK